MRKVIGMIVGVIVFLIGALLEVAHLTRLIGELLPTFIAERVSNVSILVLITVGILVFLFAWFDHKSEEPTSVASVIQPVHESSVLAPVSQTASPVLSQKVEIHAHLSEANTIKLHSGPRNLARHNVKFLGVRQSETDDGREVFEPERGLHTVKASFLNESAPNQKTADFEFVRARVVLKNKAGEEIASTSRPWWLNHAPEDKIHIEVNATESIILAIFGDGTWVFPFICSQPGNYWDDGRDRPTIDGQKVPSGETVAEITLVDGEKIGLNPVRVRFSLLPDGSVKMLSDSDTP
jgi:hypothetical protein